MNSVELIKELCKDKKISIAKLERDCGFSNGYIRGLRRGVLPNDRAKIIADYLGVSLDYLTTGTEKGLTNKDKRDISKTVNELMEKLDSNDGAPLFYDGEEMDEQTKLLFRNQLNSLATTVKEINKVKYNPNKNKGEK